jgi:hypothetical protein
MNIFVLITPEFQEVDPIVEEKFPDRWKFGPGQWLVAVPDSPTPQQVWEELLLGGTGRNPSGMALPLTSYYGYHPGKVWEWISTRLAHKDDAF